MIVNFLRTSNDTRVLRKQYSNVKDSNCILKENCTLLNPILLVKYDDSLMLSNYAYIEEFSRFYFIKNIKLVTGSMMEIEMSVDVLMSFQFEIKNLQCLVLRQENKFSEFIVDNELLTQTKRRIQVKQVGTMGDTYGIYLTVTGANQPVTPAQEVV